MPATILRPPTRAPTRACPSTGWAATRPPDDYEDFYDGSWDDEANDKNESGTDGTDTSMSDNYPWTGCEHDGTEALDSHALGDSAPASAIPIPPLLATAPFSSDTNAANINTVPYTVSRNSSRWLPPPPPTTHH